MSECFSSPRKHESTKARNARDRTIFRVVRGLRIPNAHVLRHEEAGEQRVDAEQSLAGQRHDPLAGLLYISLTGERSELVAEPVEDIDAVLTLEVRRAHAPQLELQHQLADHAL